MESIREIMKTHAGVVTEAQALIDAAEGEKRGLSDEEQASFDALCEKAETLQAQITKIEANHNRLRKLALEPSQPEKPAGEKPSNILSRAAFDALGSYEQYAFVKGGGVIKD